MIKSNTLKVPGQTRVKKRQQNNANKGNRVRLLIFLIIVGEVVNLVSNHNYVLLNCERNIKLSHFPQKCDTHLSP